jgi:hypothetical protein
MFVAWWLLVPLLFAVVVVGWLLLVVRRALHELFFWRGAFSWTIHEVETLVADVSSRSTQAARPAPKARRRVPASVGDRNIGELADDPKPAGTRPALDPQSVIIQYASIVESVSTEAARQRIDWPADSEREYYELLRSR